MPSLKTAALSAAPVAVVAMADPENSMMTQGASAIMNLAGARARREATKTAITKAAAPEAAGLIAKGASAIGGKVAGKAAILALPVAGEAIGAAMLGYDVFRIGYTAATGKNFDDTKIGQAITKAENGTIHLAANAAGAGLDMLGMRGAARFTRTTISEVLTGTPASGKDQDNNPPPLLPKDKATIVMTPGPKTKMNSNDWHEKPYNFDMETRSQLSPTTPMSRAFGTMNALADDSGLHRSDALTLQKTPAKETQIKKTNTHNRDDGLD